MRAPPKYDLEVTKTKNQIDFWTPPTVAELFEQTFPTVQVFFIENHQNIARVPRGNIDYTTYYL